MTQENTFRPDHDLPPKSENVDWSKELRGENSDSTFNFIIPKDPEAIARMVTSAVYLALAGHEITDREMARDMEELPQALKSEEGEILVRDLHAEAREILSGENGYQYEWDEAELQGDEAAQKFLEDPNGHYKVSYDYWQLRPVKADIYVDPNPSDPNTVVMRAPMVEVGGSPGFPRQLMNREVRYDELNERGTNLMDYLRSVCEKLGFDFEIEKQDMFNESGKLFFIQALNDAGHNNFDAVRTAFVYDGSVGYPKLSFQEKYWMLSEDERISAQMSREETLSQTITIPLQSGESAANLVLSFWTRGRVWFNREHMKMEGIIDPSSRDKVFGTLYPTLTEGITDQDLLAMRKQAQAICDEINMTRKPNPWA